jgi:hypothetical protein
MAVNGSAYVDLCCVSNMASDNPLVRPNTNGINEHLHCGQDTQMPAG